MKLENIPIKLHLSKKNGIIYGALVRIWGEEEELL